MILVDVNILLYAATPESKEHDVARTWLEAQLNEGGRVGLAWSTLLAFVRLQSNPRIASRVVAPAEAWALVEGQWLSHPNVWIPEPGETHSRILKFLFSNFATTSRKVTDAHLAALAIEHGLTLCSADGDFTSIPALQWMNPLRPNSLRERPPWARIRENPGRWHGDPQKPVVYARAKAKTGKPSSRKPRR